MVEVCEYPGCTAAPARPGRRFCGKEHYNKYLQEYGSKPFHINDPNKKLKELVAADDEREFDKTLWEYIDKKKPEIPDWRDYVSVAEEHQSLQSRSTGSQDIGHIKFQTKERYIKVVISADWHGGSICTDYKQLKYYLEFILKNKLYMITVGDLIDNFRRFRSLQAVFQQCLTPNEQATFLAGVIREFAKHKLWLAACWGNHDVAFDESIYGKSPVKEMLNKNFMYFNGKGLLYLHVNDQVYKIGMSHFFAGSSIYNPTHSQIRAMREHFANVSPDVIVAGHKHQYAYQWFQPYPNDNPMHFVQVGTFKLDDGYSKRYWKVGQIGLPTFLLDSEKHSVIWMQTPEDAMKFN